MGKIKAKGLVILIILGGLLLAGGVAIGWYIEDIHDTNTSLTLLDPSVTNPNITQGAINFDPLRQNLKGYLDTLNLPHSLYFEYLPNGVNIRDGADQVSIAASLMKTPIVMDMYKLAEQGKIKLDAPVTIEQGDISNDNEYGDPSGLMAGSTITLRQAAKNALHNSDNTSISIIKRYITPIIEDDSEVIKNLDITYTVTGSKPTDKTLEISARSYSSILKCLYYSCFLQSKDSQELLGYLISSVGKDRIMSGVSKDIQVAHKVGSGLKAQSDCGIVYTPDKPYLLCLMFWDYPKDNGHETDPYFKKVSQLTSKYINNIK